jgi:dihydrofolate reductase
MPILKVNISMSLDGFAAGPNRTLEEPLGRGGDQLHEWAIAAQAWREAHGLHGGETDVDNEVMDDVIAGVGATVMGRRMFSGGAGPWEDDPNADAWWGDDPPFHHPVFVLTHHEREPLKKEDGTTFTFVTDGIEAALEQARAAAGDDDVAVAGGPDVVQQYLGAGLLDEMERTRVIESPTGVTHVTYRVGR